MEGFQAFTANPEVLENLHFKRERVDTALLRKTVAFERASSFLVANDESVKMLFVVNLIEISLSLFYIS